MSQAELNFSPPRIPSVSAVPTPQTCYGTLESSGLPVSNFEAVTDIGPDFGWMSQINVYQGQFTVSVNDSATRLISAVRYDREVLSDELTDTKQYVYDLTPSWHLPCFTAGRYWNGMVVYRFLAIKPPRVTGKLLVRFSFAYGDFIAQDEQQRGVLKEWDLGQTNVCELDISAVNPVLARPTWLPIQTFSSRPTSLPVFSAYQSPSIPSFFMGNITVQVAQRLQPGGIFPDSIRILVFRSFKNFQNYIPTDMRGSQPHCLLAQLGNRKEFPPP